MKITELWRKLFRKKTSAKPAAYVQSNTCRTSAKGWNGNTYVYVPFAHDADGSRSEAYSGASHGSGYSGGGDGGSDGGGGD